MVEARTQDERYLEAAAQYGAALHRLAGAYEADPDKRRDLLQEIHLALWRSLASFDGRCSLRTWVYRVAHNAATSYVIGQRRSRSSAWLSLEQAAEVADPHEGERAAGRRDAVDRLLALVHQLKPLDRQVILSYLEGLDAAATAEITGISAGNVGVKVHRIKNLLAQRFHQGAGHGK
ncbi:MAG TPA: sigma-70 family RNA polymerase sigma factor [Bryobacteraceae bacterium]|nr:sigma-70 family RNA polymerase sigma factor [Bryobacteraceae bacterium]